MRSADILNDLEERLGKRIWALEKRVATLERQPAEQPSTIGVETIPDYAITAEKLEK